MRRNTTSLRLFLTILLLAGLFFGAAGRSLGKVDAAPMPQVVGTACFGSTITQWTFSNPIPNPSFGSGSFSYLGVNAPTYPTSVSANPPAISFNGWETSLNPNKYLEMQVSTLGRNAINLTFKASTSSTSLGPITFELQYSTDNVNFLSFDVRSITANELTYVFDFSSISDLDNAVDVRFRLFAYGGSSGSGNWRLDEISFTGNCINPGDTPTATISPTSSPVRSVIISEVAWMGTLASANHEWIELYNTTGSDINLAGWTITAADGSPVIPLSGSIPANGYYLLGNATVFSDVALSLTYSGSLSDSGETLTLKDPGNVTIDTANGNGGAWPAGALTTSANHGTMERFGTGAESDAQWYTSTGNWTRHDIAGNLIHGTPGGGNSLTPTPTVTLSPTITLTPTKTATKSPGKTVVITEVGWMGTAASSNDEWIELYNPSTTTAVDLTGWHIRSFRGGYGDRVFIDIALSGRINASAYFLMERDSDDTISDITADLVYPATSSNLMSNNGEMLLLCSPYNLSVDNCKPSTPNLPTAVVDVVNIYDPPSVLYTNPWPAGGSSPYYGSMERKILTSNEDTNWFTHTGSSPRWGKDANGNSIRGTPKHPNWAFTVTATPLATYTPTRTRTPVPKPAPILVINEFLARAGTDWNNDGKVDVYDEFIEVINAGTVDLNLNSYKLDDYELDAAGKIISNAFVLPSKILKPGERAVYYGSETGILLNDAGDTVRLLRSSNSAVVDAVSYPLVKALDASVCRYTDGYGSWINGCFPTPGQPNALYGDRLPPTGNDQSASACLLPDSVPDEFVLAECTESGLGIWNRSYWDSFPGEGDELWQSDELDKWLVIYE